MAEVVRPELASVDPTEVSDWLLEKYPGASIRVWAAPDGLHVIALGKTTATMTANLDAFAPTSTIDREGNSTYRSVHPALRAHLAHLDSYLRADPALITAPTTVHVLKDTIRAVLWLLRRDPAIAEQTGSVPVIDSTKSRA